MLAPQGGDFRRYHTADNMTWQVGRHQLRFGFEWQFDRGDGFLSLVEPASMVLYSPQIVQAYNADPRVPPQARIPLPTSFRSLNDILQLPLIGADIGLGDPRQPPSFGFEDARRDHIIRFYWQDRWRVHPRLAVNYGLAYHFQTDLANYDLSKPDYLAPLLGARGLAPTKPRSEQLCTGARPGLDSNSRSQNGDSRGWRNLLRHTLRPDALAGTFHNRSTRDGQSRDRYFLDTESDPWSSHCPTLDSAELSDRPNTVHRRASPIDLATC